MTVASAYRRSCERVGFYVGSALIGTALGAGCGSLAAFALTIQEKAGLIFGAASGGFSSPLFRALKPTDAPSSCKTVFAATASLCAGATAGYGTLLTFSNEPTSPQTFLRLAGLTCGFGLATVFSLRWCCSRMQSFSTEQPPTGTATPSQTRSGYVTLDLDD